MLKQAAELRSAETVRAAGFNGHVFERLTGRIEALGNDLPGELIRKS